jgi:hypothetical protein
MLVRIVGYSNGWAHQGPHVCFIVPKLVIFIHLHPASTTNHQKNTTQTIALSKFPQFTANQRVTRNDDQALQSSRHHRLVSPMMPRDIMK